MRRPHSIYELTCECGQGLRPHSTLVSCLCCRRLLKILWQQKNIDPAPATCQLSWHRSAVTEPR
jgi:hypothetical protein